MAVTIGQVLRVRRGANRKNGCWSSSAYCRSHILAIRDIGRW